LQGAFCEGCIKAAGSNLQAVLLAASNVAGLYEGFVETAALI
jgi:hypothetical protein